MASQERKDINYTNTFPQNKKPNEEILPKLSSIISDLIQLKDYLGFLNNSKHKSIRQHSSKYSNFQSNSKHNEREMDSVLVSRQFHALRPMVEKDELVKMSIDDSRVLKEDSKRYLARNTPSIRIHKISIDEDQLDIDPFDRHDANPFAKLQYDDKHEDKNYHIVNKYSMNYKYMHPEEERKKIENKHSEDDKVNHSQSDRVITDTENKDRKDTIYDLNDLNSDNIQIVNNEDAIHELGNKDIKQVSADIPAKAATDPTNEDNKMYHKNSNLSEMNSGKRNSTLSENRTGPMKLDDISAITVKGGNEKGNLLSNKKINSISSNSGKQMSLSYKLKDFMSAKITNKVNLGGSIAEMSEQQLRKFNHSIFELNNYPKCVFIVDMQLRIVYYNQQITEILLFDKEQLIDQHFSTILPPEYSTEITTKLLSFVHEYKNYGEDEDLEIKERLDINIMDKYKYENNFKINLKSYNYTIDDTPKCLLFIYADFLKNEGMIYCLDPRNMIYLVYSVTLMVIITLLIIYLPYDLAFGVKEMNIFNFWLDMIVMGIFIFDIILNFFLAYEDDNGEWQFDICLVSYEYLRFYFLVDVLATFPFDYVFNENALNTQILKGFKLIKILRLIKILKLSNMLTIQNKNLRVYLGYELVRMLNQANGVFELMRQNLYILVVAHYYTIFFFYFKSTIIEQNSGDYYWLERYHGITDTENYMIYLKLLNENVKTALALGEGPYNLMTSWEIGISLAYMFIGLSMFGYGIGNISSYLNYMNHAEIEYNDTKVYFNDICESYNVDPKIVKLVNSDIDQFFRNYNETNLSNKGKVISQTVYNQLEAYVMRDFISSFPLLTSLSLNVVRHLKNNATFSKGNKFYVTKGSVISDIFFITKGKLSFFDDKMHLINAYSQHENYGPMEFVSYLQLKYRLDVADVFQRIEVLEDQIHGYHDKGSINQDTNLIAAEYEHDIEYDKLKVYVRDCIKQHYDQLRYDATGDLSVITNIAEENQVKIVNEDIPVSSEDIEFFSIPFHAIEGVLFNDFENFVHIFKYFKTQYLTITEKESKDSQDSMEKFENTEMPGLMVTEKGEIYDVNHAALTSDRNWTNKLTGLNLLQLITIENDKNKINEMNELQCDQYKIMVSGIKKYIKITEIENKFVRSGNDINRNHKDNNKLYYNLKKCMINVYIIYFTTEDYYRV